MPYGSFVIMDSLDAAYRFYRSRCEDESAKRRGKDQVRKTSKRRHERLVRVSIEIGIVTVNHFFHNRNEKREKVQLLGILNLQKMLVKSGKTLL